MSQDPQTPIGWTSPRKVEIVNKHPLVNTQEEVNKYLIPQTSKAKVEAEKKIIEKKVARAENWETDEDVLLAECWASATTNSIKGTDQKAFDFKQDMWSKFQYKWKATLEAKYGDCSARRTISSIDNRVKNLLKLCQRFNSCYAEVTTKYSTGNISNTDVMNAAKALYQGKYSEEGGKKEHFKHQEVFEIWRDLPKFKNSREAQKNAQQIDIDSDDVEATEGPSGIEVVGRDKAKKMKTAEKEMEKGQNLIMTYLPL